MYDRLSPWLTYSWKGPTLPAESKTRSRKVPRRKGHPNGTTIATLLRRRARIQPTALTGGWGYYPTLLRTIKPSTFCLETNYYYFRCIDNSNEQVRAKRTWAKTVKGWNSHPRLTKTDSFLWSPLSSDIKTLKVSWRFCLANWLAKRNTYPFYYYYSSSPEHNRSSGAVTFAISNRGAEILTTSFPLPLTCVYRSA